MKKALIAGLLSIILVLPSTAQAGGYHYGHGGYYYGHGDDALIAAGIIGGAILLGSLLSPPRYYTPPPVYYRPPPAYVPTCYEDRVWRRLPDGRIQTGTRTRCY